MTEAVTVGAVVPRGWRFGAAVLAGLLVLCGAAVVVHLIPMVREAHLYRERTGEGMLFFGVALQFLAAGGLLLVAQKLSVAAHGDARTAPRAVRLARKVTWLLLGTIWISAMFGPEVLHGHCFRSCAPFPH